MTKQSPATFAYAINSYGLELQTEFAATTLNLLQQYDTANIFWIPEVRRDGPFTTIFADKADLSPDKFCPALQQKFDGIEYKFVVSKYSFCVQLPATGDAHVKATQYLIDFISELYPDKGYGPIAQLIQTTKVDQTTGETILLLTATVDLSPDVNDNISDPISLTEFRSIVLLLDKTIFDLTAE